MIWYKLKIGRAGFVLTGVVTTQRTEHAAVMAEQPWGQVARILAEHDVTLAEVVRYDAMGCEPPRPVNDRRCAMGGAV